MTRTVTTACDLREQAMTRRRSAERADDASLHALSDTMSTPRVEPCRVLAETTAPAIRHACDVVSTSECGASRSMTHTPLR